MPLRTSTGLENKIRLIIGVLIVLVVIAILILGGVPPVSRDALTHHLAVPKIYIASGGLVELPDYPFSYYPMNLNLLYLVPLYWGNDILPKYIHFLFALATAALIFTYLKRKTGSTWGLLGALLFISLPVIVKLSITVYVDLGLVFSQPPLCWPSYIGSIRVSAGATCFGRQSPAAWRWERNTML